MNIYKFAAGLALSVFLSRTSAVRAGQAVPDGQWYGKVLDSQFIGPKRLAVITEKALYLSSDDPMSVTGVALFEKGTAPFRILGGNEKAWYMAARDQVDWDYQGLILEKVSDGHITQAGRIPSSATSVCLPNFQSDLVGAFVHGSAVNITVDGCAHWRPCPDLLPKGENVIAFRWIGAGRLIVGGDNLSVASYSLGKDGRLSRDWITSVEAMHKIASIYAADDKLCWVSGNGPIVALHLNDGSTVAATKEDGGAYLLSFHNGHLLGNTAKGVGQWTLNGKDLHFDGFLNTLARAVFYDNNQNPIFINPAGDFVELDEKGQTKRLNPKIDNHALAVVPDPNFIPLDDPETQEALSLSLKVGPDKFFDIDDRASANKNLKTQRERLEWEINEMKRILADQAASPAASAPASQPASQRER